jgi:hypothetical protein
MLRIANRSNVQASEVSNRNAAPSVPIVKIIAAGRHSKSLFLSLCYAAQQGCLAPENTH